jgi:hypothetical protein
MDSRSRSQFNVEFVWLTTEQQDRILGGMEHPCDPERNGDRGAQGRRTCAAADQLAMPRQKKVEGV